MAAASEGKPSIIAGDLPPPQILLRCPGTLQLFKAPSKEEADEGLKNDLTAAEQRLPELEATITEWSK